MTNDGAWQRCGNANHFWFRTKDALTCDITPSMRYDRIRQHPLHSSLSEPTNYRKNEGPLRTIINSVTPRQNLTSTRNTDSQLSSFLPTDPGGHGQDEPTRRPRSRPTINPFSCPVPQSIQIETCLPVLVGEYSSGDEGERFTIDEKKMMMRNARLCLSRRRVPVLV